MSKEPLLRLLALSVGAILLGLSIAASPQLMAAAMIACAIFALSIVNPIVGLILALCTITGVFPPEMLPVIPLGGFEVRPGEVLLILIGIVSLRNWRKEQNSMRLMLRPIVEPLILLAALYLMGSMYSVFFKNDAYGLAEVRNIVGWFGLLIAIDLLAQDFHQFDSYLRRFAVVVALLMIIQTFFGVQLLFSDRGAEALSERFDNVIRSSAGPANFLIGYAIYYSIGRIALSKTNMHWVAALIILTLGLAATFTRGAWLALIIGLVVFLLMTRRNHIISSNFVVLGFIVFVFFTGFLFANPDLAGVLVDRIASVTEEGEQGTSVGFRLDENSQAIDSILENPFLGVGIGGEYKKFTGTRGTDILFGEFTYIHNSYLGLAVKFGILGLFVPFWIFRNLWLVWIRHRPMAGEPVDGLRLNLAAAIAALCMFMVNSLSQPEWLRIGGILVLSLLTAIVLAVKYHLDLDGG
jgi:O-antigen ligase